MWIKNIFIIILYEILLDLKICYKENTLSPFDKKQGNTISLHSFLLNK